MLTYRQCIDEIRAYLNSPDQSESEKIHELAERYATGCRELNDRLRRCEMLIEQGFRSQAIALAEVEPILLDMVALFDFRERDEWEEIVATYSHGGVYSLQLDAADRLNDSYEIEKTMEPLLRKHRRLALSKAPLAKRISTLRKIARRDTTPKHWLEALKEFEAVRVQQLLITGRTAVEHSEFYTLENVVREWFDSTWTVSLTTDESSEFDTLYCSAAKNLILPRLANEITGKHAVRDVTQLCALKKEWDQVLGRVHHCEPRWNREGLSFGHVKKAFTWLELQLLRKTTKEQHRRAVAKLRSALLQNSSLEEIEALEAEACSFEGCYLPPEVAQQLRAYHDSRSLHVMGEMIVWGVVIAVVGGFLLLLIARN